VRVAFALAGLGGLNAHGAGFLDTARAWGITPDLVTATSGQILVLSAWLQGLDLRHQLISSAQTPPSSAAQAVGAKLFAELIDEMADRIAGKPAKSTSDPALIKLRSFQ